MFQKHLWKSDILSKHAGRRPTSLLKMPLFHRCFSNNLLHGFYISGTLIENGLIYKDLRALVQHQVQLVRTHR